MIPACLIPRIHELRRCQDGVASIELAFAATLLTILLLGMIEYASAIHQSVQLQQAARVGAEFAVKYPADSTGIEQAVANATDDNSGNLTVTVTQFCECPDGTSADCTGTCAGGVAPDTFVKVALVQPASSYLPSWNPLSNLNLKAAATLRAK